MAEDFLRIRNFVQLLVRRERALLLLRVVARTAVLLVLLLVFMALAAAIRLDRGPAMLLAIAIAGIGGWAAVAFPFLVEWRPTGDPLRQARRVEGLRPDLRGRLVTAIGGPSGSESEALLGLVVRKAAAAVGGLGAAEVHPARPAVRALGGAALAGAVAMVVLLATGPSEVARFWLGGPSALAEAVGIEVHGPEDLARVGDIVVRYTYPDYTGIEPKIVPNGTGDLQAPPGTLVEVTARAADEIEAAGIVAYEERLEAVVGEDRRTLTGRFSIGAEEGVWHMLLFDRGADGGGEAQRSRDFQILPQADLPPDVMLDAQAEVVQIAVDGRFPLQWQARDDYGVRKVGVAIDGKETDRILERPDRRRADLEGKVTLSPRDLGLSPGDRVRISVVAWDNDTVSGSKKGESRAIEVVVLGAAGVAQQNAERREELLKQMVPVLARFLTDPWPPGENGGEVVRWGETVAARYRPLAQTVEQLWTGMDSDTYERAIVEKVLDSGRALVRYTQTAFEPSSTESPSDDAFKMTGGLKEAAVVALEDGILALHAMRRNDALRQVAEKAKELEAAADRLEQALAQAEPDAQALLAELDMLERMLERLAEDAAQLDESGLREFLNQRQAEAQSTMDEIRKAIAEGRTDDARKMMERLSEMIREMGEGIQREMQRNTQEAGEANSDAEDLKKELRDLAEAQKKLRSEVQALQQEDSAGSEQMKDLWEELATQAAEHRDDAAEYAKALEDAGRPFYEQERAADGAEQAGDVVAGVAARDATGTREAVAEGRMAFSGARRALEAQLQLGEEVNGPGRRDVVQLLKQLAELDALLDKLEQASSQADPETMERSQELEGQQRDLQNRLQQANDRAKALEQQFPVRPEGMQEALDDAGERMGQASEDLSEGQPMQAEGSQGVAGQRIEEAIEALEKAQKQAQQQQQQGGQGSEGEQQESGQEPSDEDGQSNEVSRRDLEIPGREEFRTPEEYRRALLEGMDGEVPEEYRAMKRRYFEELVSQ